MKIGALLAQAAGAALFAGAGALWFSVGRPPAAPQPPAVSVDLRGPSAWLQNEVRGILARHGVKDAAIVKNFNQEKNEAGARWLHETLEIEPPPRFSLSGF